MMTKTERLYLSTIARSISYLFYKRVFINKSLSVIQLKNNTAALEAAFEQLNGVSNE